jgi:mono/diheme cytochrome c family protein
MRQIAVLIVSCLAAAAAGPDFAAHVQPILKRRCSGCHGAALQMNGLRLDHGPSALKGSYSGPVIVAGKSGESALIQRVSSEKDGFRMPPAGPRLTPAEVAALKSWIDSGAKFPDEMMKAEAPRRQSSHWSFQPVKRPEAPPVKNAAWIRNPIDRFVLARLEKEGIAPSPEASRATLLRRVSLDLTGLPPPPELQLEFLADKSPQAYERVVDRLLASPHYGERWARPWLDLAHYADSDGYEKDLARPHAWRYRQWVIDAINADMPFDEFTIQQLAGDLMPNRTTESMVATGFLRNTLTNREAGVDRQEDRFEQLVNRTNTVSTTWLGLAMGCAQCHDHKYDPLSQKDYYSLLSFFDRSREAMIDAPMPGELGPYLRALPGYREKRAALLAEYDVPALEKLWEGYIVRSIKEPGWSPEWDFSLTSMKAMFDGAVPVLLTPASERSEADRDRLTDYFVHRTGLAPELPKEKMERLKELRKKLDALDEATPKLTQAMVILDDPQAAQTRIAIKGDWRRKGIPVDANVPAVLPALGAAGRAARLDLARWLVSEENPLTPRVVANRAWHELFGRGIVRTNEDFGAQGEKPSHPELLDWLAAELRGDGWSMKRLHRLIVTSAAYRQASAVRPELKERDPENILLARQSRLRLPAELIRDNALAASGLLDTTIGGPSIRPPQPEGVDKLTYANNGKWMVSEGGDRYRRGLYIHYQRTSPYPMLMNFDEPDSNVACTRRARSNTALQALNLLNDEVFYEAAQAMAWRVEREAASGLEAQISRAFQLALGRMPADRERSRLARLHDELHGKGGTRPLAAVCRAILNTDEFITRE